MKIATIQFSPEFGEKEKNIEKIYYYIKSVETDIIIFPELSTSGYFFLSREEVKSVADSCKSEFCFKKESVSLKIAPKSRSC